MGNVRCTKAVELYEKRLDTLPHPDGVVRLVQFSHDSPGLRKLKRQISEALVLLLESDPEVVKEFAALA